MAFSFNWSGLQVPQMQRRDTSAQAIQSAGEFGRAARGYEKREADTTVTPPAEKQRRRLHPPLANRGWAGRRGVGCITESKNLA